MSDEIDRVLEGLMRLPLQRKAIELAMEKARQDEREACAAWHETEAQKCVERITLLTENKFRVTQPTWI